VTSLEQLILAEFSAVHRGAFCQFPSGGFITVIVVNPPESAVVNKQVYESGHNFFPGIWMD